MDSAGAQALVERLTQPKLSRVEQERNDDRYSFRCLVVYDGLLAIQKRNREESDE